MTVRTWRTLLGGAGLGLLAFGGYGLLTDPRIRDPGDVVVWGIAALVIHDGLWLPFVCLLGAALTRRHAWLRGVLLTVAALLAVGLPAVLRSGDDHGNASLLPLPYLTDLLVALGTVVLVTLLGALGRRLVRRHRGRARRNL